MGKRGGKIYKMQMTGYSSSVIQRVGDKEPVALTYDNDFGNILWYGFLLIYDRVLC